MKELNFSGHISHRYNEELEDIRNRVLTMGGLVEQQLADALAALANADSELAEKVVSSDYQINAIEVEVDEECTLVIARRQPTASDLRLVMAVIKTITDLERIGDEAERIGRMALHLADSPRPRNGYAELHHLGSQVRKMLHDALDAFARTDVELAVDVVRQDLEVDREYEGIIRQLITYMMEDPRSIPRVINVLWSARALERIGDRSRNICEYVIYLVKGKDVRHTDLEHVTRQAQPPE